MNIGVTRYVNLPGFSALPGKCTQRNHGEQRHAVAPVHFEREGRLRVAADDLKLRAHLIPFTGLKTV
jgi:hypothetical protein